MNKQKAAFCIKTPLIQLKGSNSYQICTQSAPKTFEEYQKQKSQSGVSSSAINQNQHKSVRIENQQQQEESENMYNFVSSKSPICPDFQCFQVNQKINEGNINPLAHKKSASLIGTHRYSSLDYDASFSKLSAASKSVIGFGDNRYISQKKINHNSFKARTKTEHRNVSPHQNEYIMIVRMKKKKEEEKNQVVKKSMLNELKIQQQNQQYLQEQKLKISQNHSSLERSKIKTNREIKETINQLERKVSAIESDIQRVTSTLVSKNSSPHYRSQNDSLSNRTSPQNRRAENGLNNPNLNQKVRITGENKSATQQQFQQIKSERNQKTTQKKDSLLQTSTINQTSYSNLEKSKIISSLLHNNSINNLQNQMIKISQNSSTQSKYIQPNIDLLNQISKSRNTPLTDETHKWGFITKQKNDICSFNSNYVSSKVPIPDTKDAFFKSLLRKDNPKPQQKPFSGTNISSFTWRAQRNTSNDAREMKNKENKQPKVISSQLSNDQQMMSTSHSSNKLNQNEQFSQKYKDAGDQKIIYQTQESQKQQQQFIQQPEEVFQAAENTVRNKSKSIPKQKYPQYFQINLSEYIKSQNQNIEKKSTININQIANDRNSLGNQNNHFIPHNIYNQRDESQTYKYNNQPQSQQSQFINQSQNTNSLNLDQYEQQDGGHDHFVRISTVKDTENSVLNDFRVEKNYIFIN